MKKIELVEIMRWLLITPLSPKRGITHRKIDANYLDSNLICKTKSYVKLQLNMSKHIREKCRILSISSILSYKRGITPTNIDAN